MGRQKQAGFAIVEAALIVVVLGLLVGVGFFVVSKNGDKKDTANQTNTTSQQKQSELQAPSAQINAELEKAAEVEAATIDESTAEIDKSVDSAIDSAASVGDSYNENEL